MSGPLVTRAQFAPLFLEQRRLLDVRAEVEFARGSFPGAVNLPILTTAEREQVGICYQQRGQYAAIALGHDLVNGTLRERRVDAWQQFAEDCPDLHLYCWRGGLRSQLAQDWLAARGVEVARVDGGYKALRNYLLEVLDEAANPARLVRIAGRTGSGKTALIESVDNSVDLERHANHRGSSFGRRATPAPCQADFENALAIDILQKRHACAERLLFVEDEGSWIGPVSVPAGFLRHMKAAPLAVIQVPLEQRIENVLQDYVIGLCRDYQQCHAHGGFEAFGQHLLDGLARIRRRLGDERYRQADSILRVALREQQIEGVVDKHRDWIRLLLTSYYDRMYDYQLSRNDAPVLFRGCFAEVLEWARAQDN